MFNETTWKEGEKLALEYMKKKGYKILYTNFSCIGVELDIVALHTKSNQLKYLKQELAKKLKKSKTNDEKMVLKKIFENQKNLIEDILVITEVKSRVTNKFGKGFEAVSKQKQQNIIRGAKFLQKQEKFSKMSIRFDVASVDEGVVDYIENAFVEQNA